MPPANENVPEEGKQGLPLKRTVQTRVTLQVFTKLDASVTCAMNGIHAVAGVTVNDGVGGLSIQTVRVSTFTLQLFVVVSVTVYVPGAA